MSEYKIALIGGSGFIGSHLIKSFLNTGTSLLVIGRNRPASVPPSNFFTIDLENERLSTFFTQHSQITVDTLIFSSALKGRFNTQSPEWIKQGVVSAPDLSAIPPKSIRRLITMGSSEEYGAYSTDSEIPEDAELQPLSSYGYWKKQLFLNGKKWQAATGNPYIHLRPFNVIGAGSDRQMFVSSLLQTLLQDQEFKMTPGEQYRSFMNVKTLNVTFDRLLTSENWSEYQRDFALNVSEEHYLSLKDIAEKARLIVGKGSVKYGALPYRSDEIWHQKPNLTMLKKLIGTNWKIKLETTLHEMVEALQGTN